MRSVLAVVFTLAFVMAGCTGPAENQDNKDPEDPIVDPGPGSDPGATGGDADLEAPLPQTQTLYMTADSLQAEPPEAGSVTMAGSFTACFVTRPCRVLEFLSPVAVTPYAVGPGEVHFTFWLESSAPVAPSSIFDNAVWFGSTYQMAISKQDGGQQAYLPDTPIKFDITVSFGKLRPFLVPSGESLRVLLINAALHEESGTLKFLYGGDTPSSVTFTGTNLTYDPLAGKAATTSTEHTGQLKGPGFPASSVRSEPGENHALHTVTVGANTTYLEVRLEQTGGATERSDLDMDLYLGEDIIAGGHTPYAGEGILLAGEHVADLRGKDLTLRVALFSGVEVAYKATVHMD